MPKKQQRMSRRGSRRGGRSRGLGAASNVQPPAFIPTLKLTHKFRFVNAGGTTVSITRKNLLNLVLTATTATTTVRLIEAIRLKKVELWTQPTALGNAPITVQLEWLGENSPSTVTSDTTMGVRPAHIRSIPPSASSNRWWSMSGSLETDVLFSIQCPANTYCDLTAELRLVEQEAPTAGDVPAGAAVGQLYGDYLDGIAGGAWVPIGLVTLP